MAKKNKLTAFLAAVDAPEPEEPEYVDDGVKRKFAVQFRDSMGLNRWEYFPNEFSTPEGCKMYVLDTYDVAEILQTVEVENYADLVARYGK